MDRSVEELGQSIPTMAAVAERVAVEKGIGSVAAGDEPATAGDGAGDGAGDDKPAEPCAKRHKTHMPFEVKEWFCSLARVKPNWTMTQCLRIAKRVLPSLFEHAHIDTHCKWFSQKTSGIALGRPRSLEPAVLLALADIVSCVCSRVCRGAGVLAELLNAPPGDTWRSVPLLRTPHTPIHAIT